MIFVHNFSDWGHIFVNRRYYRHDPALLMSQRTNRPFTWLEMRRRYPPTGCRNASCAKPAIMACLGFTVPVSVPGEPSGCCSFATDACELPPPSYCRAAAWIADEAFEHARRLHGYPMPIDENAPHLPPRKLECLRWSVIGRTDEQIALIMGAKVTTIRSYMADLRASFGVCSRTELARVALRAGLIGIEHAIP